MIPKGVQSPQETQAKEILAQISSIAERMKRPDPTKIVMSDGKALDFTTPFLEILGSGNRLRGQHWKILIGLLLSQRDHQVVVSVEGTVPKIQQEQIGLHLRSSYTQDASHTQEQKRTDKYRWCILIYRASSNVVKIYTTGLVWEDRKCRGSIATALGVPPYKLQLHYHQELPLEENQVALFEDAILLDMLLDIVTRDFVPHSRTIADGPRIQLEILQALENVQLEAEHKSSKRKLSIQERLDQKLPRKWSCQHPSITLGHI